MRKQTFDQVLNQVAAANREKLMRRAQDANRLAKVTKGRTKYRFYGVKHNALRSLINKFEVDASIQFDPNTPKMLVVAVKSAKFGLHVPQAILANGYVRSDVHWKESRSSVKLGIKSA